jgi:hypothetical protein
VISMFAFSFSFSLQANEREESRSIVQYINIQLRDGEMAWGFLSYHLPLSTGCMLACLSWFGPGIL